MFQLRNPQADFRHLDRRHLLRVGAVGLGVGVSGWFRALAGEAAKSDKKPKKSCILLWMSGGPSTIDLWDTKPGHENGGPTKAIKTTATGLEIGEYLPEMAKWGKQFSVLRGMSTKEGDHSRATFQMRTGTLPLGGIQFPSIGSLVAKELGDPKAELPNCISIAPQRFFSNEAFGAGFLGPNFAPLNVADGIFQMDGQNIDVDKSLTVQNLTRPADVRADHGHARLELLKQMQDDFAKTRPSGTTSAHASAYDRASRLMLSDAGKVFDLSQEKDAVRDRYGRTLFGQGCLLARRLVEKSVPFVEVSLGNWDTHANIFAAVGTLAGQLDKAWSALIADLKDRGLLDSTLIVWMGEFGRTPKINEGKGRDHYPNAWSSVLAGGGLKHGQAIGKTSKDGTTVEERTTSTIDLLATVCQALDIDSTKQNLSNVGRPIPIVDKAAEPIKELF